MEKKFTRAMVCDALEHKCKECPLHYCNNSTALHCWELTNDNVNTIMKDYPYVDVKVRMIFNDIETRLTKLESYVKPEVVFDVEKMKVLGDEIGIISGSYVDEKLYDKLEAKHEADCRLISEYDLEIKKLEEKCKCLEKENKAFNILLINKTITIGELGDEYDKLKEQNDKLLKDYNLLSESNNNHATDNIELEGKLEEKTLRIASLESKLRNQRANLTSLQEKYEDAVKMNKTREDVYYANIKLQKTIEAKDREIGLLRAELDKYKTDDECDDSWID